jgi:hypothetical protein
VDLDSLADLSQVNRAWIDSPPEGPNKVLIYFIVSSSLIKISWSSNY